MTQEEMQKYDSGFNEGFLYAAQVVAGAIIQNINNHPSWMLPNYRKEAIAEIKLTTRHILVKRKLVPTYYEVIIEPAKEVKLDFNISY